MTLAVLLSSDVTGDACLQLAQYGDEVQSLQQQMELEIEELKQTQQQSVTALKAEHVAEVKDIKHRLQTVNKLVHVIVPEVTALKTQYYELREQCRHLPEICRTTVEQTSRQVETHVHGTRRCTTVTVELILVMHPVECWRRCHRLALGAFAADL